MDQYEDLQKFREKTLMKSIRFVDFTKQNKEVNHGQWSIVQQLTNSNTPLASHTPPDLTSQILNTPLTNKAPDPVHLVPLTTKTHPTASTMSLLKDVGMQLNRPEAFQTEVQQQPAVQAQPQYQPQPAAQSQTNFSHLFTAPVEETPVVEEETSLQSLLKRIATCR